MSLQFLDYNLLSMKNFKIFVLISMLFTSYQSIASSNTAGYQFNFNLGQDNPDEGETRTGAATMARFAISTKPRLFRMVGAFTALTGGGLQQGEFSAGPHLYPFGNINRGFIQPYLFAEGSFGIGTFEEKTRYDSGYGVGVGCDFFLSKKGGMTLAVEKKQATESAYRLWIGFIYQGR